MSQLLATIYAVQLSFGEESLQAALVAAAAGKRLVPTRVGRIPEAVADGGAGLLVLLRNPRALMQAMKEFLANPIQAWTMREAGRAWNARTLGVGRAVKGMQTSYGGPALKAHVCDSGGR